ncbi:lipase [Amycolatopsis sp. NPDC059027]|uniref:lipase n=1 Tax=Amycolatopsis sp. NPDC059027 TaxID=3346709 RepID=UPI00366BABCA
MTSLHRWGAALVAGVVACALVAGPGSGSAEAQERGRLADVVPLRTVSAADVAGELAATGFDAGEVRYGVRAFRLEYRTVDARNRPATASGLLMVPEGGSGTLSTVVTEHGTTSYRGDAPSIRAKDFATSPALTYASAGFATVAPDYLGLGTGPGFHPWMDVPSETTASLDMLRATREFLGHRMGRDVLVAGFSQGASAALGLARALDGHADPRFRLRALAPISGGYAFRDAEIPALLAGELETKSSALYAAYLLVSWNRLHHLYRSPSEIFRAPYDRTIEELFDGNHTGKQLMAGTPGTLGELITPAGIDLLRHPSPRFAAALRVADGVCTGWKPGAPMRLYVMDGDDQAATANTDRCVAGFAGAGVRPEVVRLPHSVYNGSTHLASNVTATGEIVRWFLREAA